MPLLKVSPLVGSLAVLLAATVPMASRAQDPPPAAPAAPATPTLPAAAPPISPISPTAPSDAEMKRARDAYLQAVQAMNKARDAMNAQMRKQMGANAATIRGFALPSVGATYLNAFRSISLPNKTISLNVKNVSARDALAKVLDEAKIDYLIDDDFPKNEKLTLSIEGVQLSTALDLITQSAGARWVAEKRGGKILVRAGKNVRSASLFSTNGSPMTFSYAAPQGLYDLNQARVFSDFAPLFTSASSRNDPKLTNTVSLDLRDANVRDALIKVLDKQKLAYEISDDFPKNAKITISVTDTRVSDVLDRLTQSVGTGWTAEKRGGKTVIRIGKKGTSDPFFYFNGSSAERGGSPLEAQGALTSPTIRVDVLPALPDNARAQTAPLLYQFATSEQRSTFTCPKCGKQTTIVQKKTDKKLGGDKPQDAWHYCPYCGKKVADSGAARFELLWPEPEADAPSPSTNVGFCKPYTITMVQGDLCSASADGGDNEPHWKIDFTN